MFDTYITVVGNVCTKPQSKELPAGPVTEFRIASTSRRYHKQRDEWVDGDELFIRVSCWRTLAVHVQQSIHVGDPVIVRGRLHSRRYTDKSGASRTGYEINALAVGHDLARGVARFARQRSRSNTDTDNFGSTNSEFDAIIESMNGADAEESESTTSLTSVANS